MLFYITRYGKKKISQEQLEKRTISPLIDKLQVHLDIFPDKEKKEHVLVEQGFVNYNLCLNAQREHKHTECDASYTVISVPSQLGKVISKQKQIKTDLNSI